MDKPIGKEVICSPAGAGQSVPLLVLTPLGDISPKCP